MITSNAKILCVDDEPDLLNITEDILRSAGFKIIRATTGHECLTLAKKEHPDLILLDVVLPDIDGFDVCKQLKSDRELFDIYIILISGREITSETQAKGLDAGADGYIARPVSGRELLARIEAMLRLKQAETAQREMNIRLNTLIDSIPDAIFFEDMERRHILVNKAAESMTGLKREQFPSKTSEQILPPDLAEMCRKSDEEVIKRRESVRIEESMTDNKGETIFLDTIKSPIFDEQGNMTGFVGISRDITEQKKANADIQFKSFLLDNTSDLVIVYDFYGKFLYINNAVCKMTGYTKEEMMKLSLKDLSTLDDTKMKQIMETLIKKGEAVFEDQGLRKNGSLFPVEVKASVIEINGRKIITSVSRDITERKKAEEAIKKLNEDLSERFNQLLAAQTMADTESRAKSEFLANMSHELTTPLNSIIGFSQILQDCLYGELNDKQKEYISDILQSGIHLLGLLNDMLDISKLDAGTGELKKNRFLLKDLLTTMIGSFKKKSLEKNILLGFEIAPEAEIEIEADLVMIKQIMFNLLDNALKYTPDGGSVSVQARLVNSEQYLVNSKRLFTDDYSLTTDRNFVEISVADTGIGINQEDIPNLFRVFTQLESPYTKKYMGTGIGLALTKKLVELHGGRLWAESEYGKGSRFTFIIPIQKEST